MSEEKKESLYDTLFRVSQGDVELFKEETDAFLTAVSDYTGSAAARLQRSDASDESEEDTKVGGAAAG